MTVFGGANDQERKPGLWPADIPLNTPIEVCNAMLAERLTGFKLDFEPPVRMRVNDVEPAIHPEPILIDLVPYDEDEAIKLHRLRDRLSDLLKIRQPDHDRYAYHISIAYLIEQFNAQEQADYIKARRRWRAELKRRVSMFQFGGPEYCTLKDMFAFRRRLVLS